MYSKEERRVYARNYRAKNLEKMREYQRDFARDKRKHDPETAREKDRQRWKKTKCQRTREKYQQSYRERARRLIYGAKTRAKKTGRIVDLRVEFIEEKLRYGRCERTGLSFEFILSEKHRCHPRSPSLDRIDSNGDYTEDNVEVTCLQYNRAKGEWNLEDLLEMCSAFQMRMST